MTKLTDRLWNKRINDEEDIEHEFTRDELDALSEMAQKLGLNSIYLDGVVGGPKPDELLTVNFFVGDKAVKIEGIKNDDARELWELLTHLPDLIRWAKERAKF